MKTGWSVSIVDGDREFIAHAMLVTIEEFDEECEQHCLHSLDNEIVCCSCSVEVDV